LAGGSNPLRGIEAIITGKLAMTTPPIDSHGRTRAESLQQWFILNSRILWIAAAVVVVAAGGTWFYARSNQIKAANGAKRLLAAKQSIGSGNLALGQSDLQKVAEQYKGTAAGVEAALLLAQVYYDQRKFTEGIAVLEQAATKAPGVVVAGMRTMMADGYLELGKAADAAKAYEAAAAASPYKGEQASIMSRAASAYLMARDSAKAMEIWGGLRENTSNQLAAITARVRYGELTAKPAPKG
jgi:predicted negative regulator of RcsB-dependent stress response